MASVANNIRRYASTKGVNDLHQNTPYLDKRWSVWWMILFGHAADNRLFSTSKLWYLRLFVYAVIAAIAVTALVLTHVLALTVPVAVLVTLGSAFAFNFGLDFLRDHLTPTMRNASRLNRPWLQWLSRSNHTDSFGRDGKLVRQSAGTPSELAYFYGADVSGDTMKTDAARDRMRFSSVRNANQSFIRGFAFILFALITVAGVSALLTPAGLLTLAIPAVTSLAFAFLAWGFNRLAIHVDQQHRTRDGNRFDPNAHPGWQWLSNALYVSSGLCAVLSVVSIAWVGWPQAMIAKAMALTQMPATVTGATLATQAGVLGGLLTAASLVAGLVIGGIRSLTPFSAAKVTGLDVEANEVIYHKPDHATENIASYIQEIGLGLDDLNNQYDDSNDFAVRAVN